VEPCDTGACRADPGGAGAGMRGLLARMNWDRGDNSHDDDRLLTTSAERRQAGAAPYVGALDAGMTCPFLLPGMTAA
ncbi:hypothetical protein AB0J43_50965, partial [Nonomuraea fuscirosea]